MGIKERWQLFDEHSSYVDRFGLLLVVTTLAVVVLALVDLRASDTNLRSEFGQILVSLLVGATLLLSVRASGVGQKFRRLADLVVGFGVLATIIVLLLIELGPDTQSSINSGAPSSVWVVLSVLAPVLVVRRLLRHKRASAQTLLGAVSAYLLIALAFNFLFLSVDVFGQARFFGTEEPTTSFMYFSLVSISTLGYGDLAAAEPFGRLLSTTEAVIGQVYLVTIVAMIVGLLVAHRGDRATTD